MPPTSVQWKNDTELANICLKNIICCELFIFVISQTHFKTSGTKKCHEVTLWLTTGCICVSPKIQILEPGGCMLSIHECRFTNRLQFFFHNFFVLNKTNSYSFNLFVAKKDFWRLTVRDTHMKYGLEQLVYGYGLIHFCNN